MLHASPWKVGATTTFHCDCEAANVASPLELPRFLLSDPSRILVGFRSDWKILSNPSESKPLYCFTIFHHNYDHMLSSFHLFWRENLWLHSFKPAWRYFEGDWGFTCAGKKQEHLIRSPNKAAGRSPAFHPALPLVVPYKYLVNIFFQCL